jgi:hypothetical protein
LVCADLLYGYRALGSVHDGFCPMAADSLREPSEAGEQSFLHVLSAKWRELREAPAVSAAGIGVRPAREAAELRRLIGAGRRAGLPEAALARIWRSLCGEIAAERGLSAVCVAGGDASQSVEAARGYFGFAPPVALLSSVREALERALSQQGALACLPWPEPSGAGQWWAMLNENRFHPLVIVDSWTCLSAGPAEATRVAIVGRMSLEPSGDDDMLAVAHDDNWTAEAQLRDLGLGAEVTARARSLVLIRLNEFVAPDDVRLDLARKAGLDGLRIVGVRPRL